MLLACHLFESIVTQGQRQKRKHERDYDILKMASNSVGRIRILHTGKKYCQFARVKTYKKALVFVLISSGKMEFTVFIVTIA